MTVPPALIDGSMLSVGPFVSWVMVDRLFVALNTWRRLAGPPVYTMG